MKKALFPFIIALLLGINSFGQTITIGNVSNCSPPTGSTSVCIPVTATSGFNGYGVGALTLYIQVSNTAIFDNTTSLTVTNLHSQFTALGSGNQMVSWIASPGIIGFSWFSNNGGATIANGDLLFNICFPYTGGSSTFTAFSNAQYVTEAVDWNSLNQILNSTNVVSGSINELFIGAAGTITGPASVCQGASGIQFSVDPISNAVSYTWSVPSGVTFTAGATPNIINATFANNYSGGAITVKGVDACGNIGTTSSITPTVNLLPTAPVITGTSPVCQSVNTPYATFTYSVPSVANTTYQWTVPTNAVINSGQGTNSISVSFPPTATSGNITALGTNLCGTGLTAGTKAIVVNTTPVANAGTDLFINNGASATLSGGPSGAGLTYLWAPAASLSNAAIANPTTSSLTNSQVYCLTVTNTTTNPTCSSFDCVTINVSGVLLAIPNANISASPSAVCPGAAVQLTGQAIGGVLGNYTYTWFVGATAISTPGSNPTITVNPTTTTTYTLSVNDGATTATNTVIVTVYPLPAINFPPMAPVCVSAPSINLMTYTTTPGGTFTGPNVGANTFNPFTALIAPSTNTITYTVTSVNNCISSITNQLTVNPLPMVLLQLNPAAVCTNAGLVQLTGGTPSGLGTYSGTGTSTGGMFDPTSMGVISATVTTNITYSYTEPTTGCNNAASQLLTINPKPAAAAGSNVTICAGTSTQIGGSQVGVNTYSWTSTPASTVPSIPNPSVSPAATTTYTVTETIPATGCANTNSVIVTVNEPTAGQIAGSQTICNGGDPVAFTVTTAATGTALTYQWQSASSAGGPWTNILSATASTYDPGTLTTDTWYRRVVTSTLNTVGCDAISGSVKITINNVTSGTVAGDQTICNGGDPLAFTQTIPATGSTLTYQWQSATTSGGPWTNISLATNDIYDPGTLTVNTWFRRVVTSTLDLNSCSANSNEILVTINNVTSGTVATDQTICAGEDVAAFTVTTAATGSTLTYQWQIATNAAGPWSDIGLATAATYDPGTLTDDTWYRRVVTSTLNGNSCVAISSSIHITINVIDAGLVSANQTICNGDDVAAFTVSTSASGTSLAYQWQSATAAAGPWANISGSTNATYDPGTLTVDTWYRRFVTSTLNSHVCTALTNEILITINNVTAGSIAADQTICSGDDVAPLTVITAATGTSLSYQWQSALSAAGPWVDINGATNDTYDPGTLTVDTWYRRVVTSSLNNKNCAAISASVHITINNITAGVIAGDQTICSGDDVAAFTVTTGATGTALTYQWQIGTSSTGPWTNISTANLATYNEGTLTTDTWYRRVVTSTLNSNNCTSISNVLHITINHVDAGVISSDQTICSGDDVAAFTETTTASGTALTYQWQSASSAGGPWSNISLANGATYDHGSLTSDTWFRRVVTSTLNLKACTVISNVIKITINNVSAGVIAGNQTICNGDDVAAFTVTTASTGTALTYQWQIAPDPGGPWSNIASATSDTYDHGTLTTNTWFRRIATSSLNLNACPSISNVLQITINQVTAGVISGDQTICFGVDADPITTTTAATGTALTYQWQSAAVSTGPFTNIVGSTSASIDPPAVPSSICYRRIAYSTLDNVTCQAISNVVCITVNPLPVVSVGPDLIVPYNTPAVLSTTPTTGPYTYLWSNATNLQGGINNLQTVNTVNITVTQTYVVTVTNSTTGCTNTDEINVSYSGGQLSISITGSSALVCEGTSVTLTAVPQGGNGGNTFHWNSTQGAISSTSAMLTVTPTVTTTYSVTVTDNTNNTATSSFEVVVNNVTAGVVASDQTICNGDDPAAFTQLTASTGTALTYQWQSATSAGGPWTNIGGATGITYDPTALTVDTWFKRIATSTLSGLSCTATSNVLKITINNVDPGVVAGIQTICINDDPAAFTQTTSASGTALTYQWQSALSAGGPWTNISGAQGTTYDPGALSVDTWYRRLVTSTLNTKNCTAISNVLTVTINNVSAGVVAGDQTICNGDDVAAFTVTTAATGTSLTYQWQSAPASGGPWSNINLAIGATYDQGNLSANTWFRRVVTSTLNSMNCTLISNVLAVTINNITAGVISGDQTICSGDDVAAFTVGTAATGATLGYQWQSATSAGGPWTNIASATLATYDPGTLTVNTWYRRFVTSTLNSNNCTAISNSLQVTINDVYSGVVAGDQTICSGDDVAPFTVTTTASGAALTYQWQSSPASGGPWTNISFANSATYDAGTLTTNTWYRRLVTSALNGNNCTAISNLIQITINNVSAGVVAGDQTICSGDDVAAFTVTTPATGTVLTYQWQTGSSSSGPWTNINLATAATYDAGPLTVNTWYRRVVTSSLNANNCTVISNVIQITINNVSAGTVSSDQTICSGDDVALFTVTTAATGTALTYQWQSGTSATGPWTNITGAQSATYNHGTLTANTWFRRVVTSTLNSNNCTTFSNVLQVTINNVTAGVVSGSQTICTGEDPAAFTVTTTSTGAVLSYQWQSAFSAGGPWVNISGGTSETFDPGPLSVNTWYKRIVTSTLNGMNCTAISNVLQITINNVTAGSVASNLTICNGDDPNAFTQLTAATGSTLSYQWQSATAAIGPWSDIASTNSTTYNSGPLTVDTWFRRIVTSTLNGVNCTAISNVVSVTINNVTPGVVAGDLTICSGDDPPAFTQVTASTGATLSYQWQSALTAGGTWTNITAGTGAVYNPGPLTVNTWYRRVTLSLLNGNTCTAISNVLQITINTLTAGAVAGSQTVCNGDDPVAFTVTTASTGATLTYQWQSGPTPGGPWTNITGAIDPTYDPGIATSDLFYKRITISSLNGKDCFANSNVLQVKINNVTAGVVAGNQTICSGDNPAAFTQTTVATGTALTYQWQSASSAGGPWTNIAISGTGTTYDPNALTEDTYYRRVAISTLSLTPCSAISNVLSIIINTMSAGVVDGSQTICNGGDPVAFTETVSATGTAITYQWQSGPSGTGPWTNISGALSVTFDPGVLTVNTWYRRFVSSVLNGKNCTATTNVLQITINNVTAGTISGSQTICSGADPAVFTIIAAATGTGSNLSYQWQSSPTSTGTFTDIPGAISDVYDAPNLTVNTCYRRIATNTLDLVPCSAISNVLCITINDVSAGTISQDQAICIGDDPAPFAVVTAATGTGNTLAYQWQSSPTSTGTFTNILGATSSTYDPPAITTSTCYRRLVTNTLDLIPCQAISNVVCVTVNPLPGTNAGLDVTIPYNTTTLLTAQPSGAQYSYLWSNAANLQGGVNNTQSVTTTNIIINQSYTVTVTNTITGCFSIDEVLVSYSGGPLSVGLSATSNLICEGTAVIITATPSGGNGGNTFIWNSSLGAITSTSSTITVNPLLTTTYYVTVTDNTNNTAVSSTEVVVNNVTAGTIAGNQTICNGDDPLAFTVPVAATGSGNTLTYQWQSSSSLAGTYTDISGATTSTYDSPALTSTTYFRRVATNTLNTLACHSISNVIAVTINDVTAGAIAGDQTICNGDDPIAFTVSTAATGSGNTLSYQWQSSPTSTGTFTSIPGATSATYDSPSLTVNTCFRRVATNTLDLIPCHAISNVVCVTINDVSAGVVAGDQTICSGGDPSAFTVTTSATGTGNTLTYQWQQGPTSTGTFNNISGANQATYDPGSMTQNTCFRRVVTNTLNLVPCNATSNVICVTINDVSAGIIAGDQTICYGDDPLALTVTTPATGTGNNLTYQWQSSLASAGIYSDIASATNATYDPPSLTESMCYRRITTNTLNLVPCQSISNVVCITVNPLPLANAGIDQTINFNQATTLTGNSGNYSYAWTPQSSLVSPFNTQTIQTINLTSTTTFNLIITDLSTNCISLTDPIVVTVNGGALGISSLTAVPNEICAGAPVVITPVVAGGNYPLSFAWSSDQGGSFPTTLSITVNPMVSTVYTITVTDATSQVATQTVSVLVHPIPVVVLGPLTNQCVSSTTYTLNTGTPAGGTYSGTGVTGTNFNASVAGVGLHTITYNYTDQYTCNNSATYQIEVYALPNVTFTGTLTAQCVSSTTYTLTGGLPANGTYSGPGVSGTNFNASVAGVGTHTITYTFTDGHSCTSSATNTIVVKPLPVATATTSTPVICSGNTINLAGSFSGGSGTISGWAWTGTSGFNFNVQNPVVTNATVAHSGTYSLVVTDANGCSSVNTTSVSILVNPLPVVSFGALNNQCVSNTTYALTTGTPAGGTYSGTGVTGTNFNASTAGIGFHTLTYTYTNSNTCTNTATYVIEVYALPNVTFNGTLTSQCVSSTTYVLSGGLPLNGTYSGPGVSGTNFNASVAGVGTHTITYTYTDVNSCTKSATKTIIVKPVPVATAQTSTPIICSGNTINLAGSSTGGSGTISSWAWTGSTGFNFSIQNPTVINATVAYTGTYSLVITDANGCSSVNSTSVNILVNPLPVVSFGALNNQCVSSTSYSLTTGSPVSGTYTGTGVTGSNFNASVAGVGIHTLTYSFTTAAGCNSTATTNIEVYALPVVTMPNSYPSQCYEGSPFPLTGGSPLGGTYSGSFVNSNIFNPLLAGPGTYPLVYTYTDLHNCTNTASSGITVLFIPKILGHVNYDNATLSFMDSTNITLTNSVPIIVGTTVSQGGSGAFDFKCLPADSYTMQAATVKKTGGINATDAFLAVKYGLGMLPIATALRQKAADVNGNGSVNAGDGLLIMRRFTPDL